MATATISPGPEIKLHDPAAGIRGFMFFDGLVRLILWQASLALTVVLFNTLDAWPTRSPIGADWLTIWKWMEKLGHMVLVFNVAYLLLLLVLRLLIPTPKEGRYSFVKGTFQRGILWAALVSVITRARYEPPFPGFLVFHIANLPPFCWLVKWIMGPNSRSVFVLNPPIPDPDFTQIGRNVTIGWGTSITAHIQDREGVTLKKVVIEDNVMIGAEVLIYGGTTIKRGAVIYGGAVIRPDTVIGENEAWAGVPARKIKDLKPVG